MAEEEKKTIHIKITGEGIQIEKEITQEQAAKIVSTALESKKSEKKIGF